MAKKFKIEISLLACIFSVAANAKSLQEIADSQVRETIAPVVLEGHHFYAEEAQAVCAAMGFKRLISFESEKCESGETLYNFSERTYVGAVALSAGPEPCSNSFDYDRLKSVTCAK